MSIDAMKMALDVMREFPQTGPVAKAADALRAALESAQKVERVACTCADFVTNEIGYMKAFTNLPYNTDLYTAPQQPTGEVVVTTDESGRCVAVTRQDKEGNILSIIWEASLLSQPAIPDGWQLVPVEPTSEMSSFANTGVHWQIAERIYKAMLAVAPKPENSHE